MTKSELKELLNSLDIPVGEGEQFLDKSKEYPKIAYWEYNWRDVMASGDDYDEVVTYQISFVSKTPRHRKLLELKMALNGIGLHPEISHEYVKAQNGPGEYHSYFAIDVTEALSWLTTE